MKFLFKKDIIDWNSWGEVFQSIDDFRELIKAIFIKEKLTGYEDIGNLTPGTNAVFRVGNYVAKIFVPKESGYDSEKDYNVELEAMNRAIEKGINTPKVIVASSIKDKYLFRYIIMEYLNGKEGSKVLNDYSYDKKMELVDRLKVNLKKLNSDAIENIDNNFIIEKAINNKRWDKCSAEVKNQIIALLRNYKVDRYVYVHGDIIADNVMINENGELFIIDFADSTVAPIEYEWPPIIFELFYFDKDMTKRFMGDMNYDEFIEKLFMAILLHEFGVNFVESIYIKYKDKDIADLKDINEIKYLLKTNLL